MINVKFVINGREVSPSGLGGAIEDTLNKAVMNGVQNQVKQKLSQVVCSEHHQRPRVTASGTSLKQLSFSVDGCCQKLIDKAKAVLK